MKLKVGLTYLLQLKKGEQIAEYTIVAFSMKKRYVAVKTSEVAGRTHFWACMKDIRIADRILQKDTTQPFRAFDKAEG